MHVSLNYLSRVLGPSRDLAEMRYSERIANYTEIPFLKATCLTPKDNYECTANSLHGYVGLTLVLEVNTLQ